MRAILALLACLAAPALARPALEVAVVGDPVTVFDSARDGCGPHDKPDAPARAVRLADGEVVLFAPHFDNRALRGRDLRSLRPDCRIRFAGAESADPAAFSDRAWITALWTEDGRRVHAILHNEFQGHRHPGRCPTGRYLDCWYNALTAAVSEDGARRFVPAGAPPHLVAALPERAEALRGRHAGFFNPTGLVRHGGALHLLAFTTGSPSQPAGNCLLRTVDIADPAAWRGFDGAAFSVVFRDPYGAPPASGRCAPVGRGRLLWPASALLRHAPSGLFLALMQGAPHRPEQAEPAPGIYVATSPDLLTWSEPERILPAIGHGRWRCGEERPLAYPSLLDPDSASLSFETIGDRAFLFLTRFEVPGCRLHGPRSLIRLEVTVRERRGT